MSSLSRFQHLPQRQPKSQAHTVASNSHAKAAPRCGSSIPRPRPLGRDEPFEIVIDERRKIPELQQSRVEKVLLKAIRARFPPKPKIKGSYVLRNQ
jgi:hypothetical protein